jgi:DNA-binding response OmpR family regulator
MAAGDKSSRILYVEDEALVALSLAIALEEAGFFVEHVISGKAALKEIDENAVPIRCCY